MQKLITIETRGGEPISVKDTQLVPFHQVLQIRFPGLQGGLVWNRPVSILTVDADGQEQVVPVHDVTRQAVWTLFGVTLFTLLIGLIVKKRKRVAGL
jgi:hypothetical protein